MKELYFRAILLFGRCLLSIFCSVDQSEFLSIQLADLVVSPLAYHPVEAGAYRVNDRTGAGADSIFALGLTPRRPTGPIVHDGPVVITRGVDDPICFRNPREDLRLLLRSLERALSSLNSPAA